MSASTEPSLNELLRETLTSRVNEVAREMPLELAPRLSRRVDNNIWLKREDQQSVFSFKLRGAYNKISKLSQAEATVERLRRAPGTMRKVSPSLRRNWGSRPSS